MARLMSDDEGRGEAILVVQGTAPERVAHPRNRSVTWAGKGPENAGELVSNGVDQWEGVWSPARGRPQKTGRIECLSEGAPGTSKDGHPRDVYHM